MFGITEYKDQTIVDNDDMYPLLGKWDINYNSYLESCQFEVVLNSKTVETCHSDQSTDLFTSFLSNDRFL